MSLYNKTPFNDISQKEFDKLPKHIKRHLRGYSSLRSNLKDLFPLNEDKETRFINDLKFFVEPSKERLHRHQTRVSKTRSCTWSSHRASQARVTLCNKKNEKLKQILIYKKLSNHGVCLRLFCNFIDHDWCFFRTNSYRISERLGNPPWCLPSPQKMVSKTRQQWTCCLQNN